MSLLACVKCCLELAARARRAGRHRAAARALRFWILWASSRIRTSRSSACITWIDEHQDRRRDDHDARPHAPAAPRPRTARGCRQRSIPTARTGRRCPASRRRSGTSREIALMWTSMSLPEPLAGDAQCPRALCARSSRCQLSSGNLASITSGGALLGMNTTQSGRLPLESVDWKA